MLGPLLPVLQFASTYSDEWAVPEMALHGDEDSFPKMSHLPLCVPGRVPRDKKAHVGYLEQPETL